MREVTKDQISDMLEKDYVGRNQQLNSLIDVINNTPSDSSPSIALNSQWGSGKTVFVKQLHSLNNVRDVSAPNMAKATIATFHERYTTYYFNAWENDYLNDALEALLLNIIDDMDKDTKGLQVSAAEKALKIFNPSEFIKQKTDGLIDIERFSSPDDLIKEASEISDRKKKIKKILENYTEYKGKRLVFIVDELDRCKPSFAINLLEALKHYFTDNNIVFVFSVDSIQLSHTVKKYYGNDFDGAAYLDRFFDFTMTLQKPDRDKYVREYLRTSNSRYFIGNTPSYMADHFSLTLRETEHYIKSLEFVEGYMNDAGVNSGKNQLVSLFGQLTFIPLALALKVKNYQDFSLLVDGKGGDIITKLLNESKDIQNAIRWDLDGINKDRSVEELIDIVLDCYNRLFLTSSSRDDYHSTRISERVLSAVNIISQGTTIKQLESEAEK